MHNLACWALRADTDYHSRPERARQVQARKRRISREESLLGGIAWRVTAGVVVQAYSNVWAVAGEPSYLV